MHLCSALFHILFFSYNVFILMTCFHRICFSCGNQIADVFILRLKKKFLIGFLVALRVHCCYVMMNSLTCCVCVREWVSVCVRMSVLLHIIQMAAERTLWLLWNCSGWECVRMWYGFAMIHVLWLYNAATCMFVLSSWLLRLFMNMNKQF